MAEANGVLQEANDTINHNSDGSGAAPVATKAFPQAEGGVPSESRGNGAAAGNGDGADAEQQLSDTELVITKPMEGLMADTHVDDEVSIATGNGVVAPFNIANGHGPSDDEDEPAPQEEQEQEQEQQDGEEDKENKDEEETEDDPVVAAAMQPRQSSSGKEGNGDSPDATAAKALAADPEQEEGAVAGGTKAKQGASTKKEEQKPPVFYLVKLPRPENDGFNTQVNIMEMQIQQKREELEILSESVRVKQISKRSAQGDSDGVRERLREIGGEIKAKLEVLVPLQAQLRKHQDHLRSVKSAQREMGVLSVDELDAQVAHLESSLMHESLPLAEEKRIVRKLQDLKRSRESVKALSTARESVAASKDAREQLYASVKDLSSEVEVLKSQEGVLRTAFDKMKAGEREIEEGIRETQEEKGKVLKEMRELQNELQAKKRAFYTKERAFWNNRKESREVKKLVQRADFEAARIACEAYNDEIQQKLNTNDDFRNEYVRLVRKRGARRFAMVMGPWAAKLEEEEERELLKDEESPSADKAAAAKVNKKEKAGGKLAERKTQTERPPKKAERKAAAKVEEPVEQEKASVQVVESKRANPPMEALPVVPPVKDTATAQPSALANPPAPTSAPPVAPDPEPLIPVARAHPDLVIPEVMTEAEKEMLREELGAKMRFEAEERKRKAAEKAAARAAAKQQKEAEEAEKKREKRRRQKERKAAVAAGGASGGTSIDSKWGYIARLSQRA